MPRMATASDDPRIVVIYRTGRWAGLRQILGTVSQLKAELKADSLPIQVEGADLHDHKGTIVRIRTTRGAVFYAEHTGAANAHPTFHKGQQ